MITLYLRSSSENTYNLCQHKSYIEYVLGMDGGVNKAATKGSVVHKILELLALRKFAQQNGEAKYSEEEVGLLNLDTSLWEPEKYLKKIFDYYKDKPTPPLGPDDFKDCCNWYQKVLDFDNGKYNPYFRKIISPELYFEIPVLEDWAKYSYKIGGETIEGNLILRGTMDLVTEINPTAIEYIDWKTGQRKNWITGDTKEYGDLHKDFQFRLYHFALKQKFPDYKLFILTPFFVNYGGPFPLFFDDKDIPETLEIIKKTFLEIKNNVKPKLIKNDQKINAYNWKCRYLCKHSQNNYETCSKIAKEIVKLGMDRVDQKYIDIKKLHRYTGGGRDNKNE